MALLFSNLAGTRLLESLRDIFRQKKVFHRKHRFILFVCGGIIGEGSLSLRQKFIDWAEVNLPDFICLIAEDALKDSFAEEGPAYINLVRFESVIADVADCVLIFPESAGSFAETGFFANSSKIREKTLVANRFDLQSTDSFLNLGPIDRISDTSVLKPTILIDFNAADFAPIGQRLRDRVKRPEYRERLPYLSYREFNVRQKLLVTFEILRILRLAEIKTLRHALGICFGSKPRNQELTHLLRILLAAKFIQRHNEYFKVAAGLNLVEIDHLEIEKLNAQVQFFYQTYSKELYEALAEIAQ